MTETYIHPSEEQLARIRDIDLNGPVIMINLLRFDPDGGAEASREYVQAAGPHLARVGATLRYAGDVAATFIGDDEWDEALLVEYPSKQAFLDMTSAPDYPSGIRDGALTDSRLYCTVER